MSRGLRAAVACAVVSIGALSAPVARSDDASSQGSSPEGPGQTPTDSADLLVRPIFGIGLGASASGLAMDAQLGLRVSPILLRLSLSVGGHSGRGFALGAGHADWIAWSSEDLAGFIGLGFGQLHYGYLFDSPVHSTTALLPEVGLILGHRRGLGRLVLSVAAVVPTTSPSLDLGPGNRIDPPGFIGSFVVSL